MAITRAWILLPLLLPVAFAFLPPFSRQNIFFGGLKSTTSSENIENYYKMLECSDITKSEFAGKSVLLTGASGGLGKAFATSLASCQVDKLILSGRKKDALDAVAKECQALAPNAMIHVILCDLTDRDSVTKLGLEAQSRCGTIEVLINNGGISSRSSFLKTSLDVDERLMQVNFFAGAALAKILVPKMVSNHGGGKIIWISSVQGLLGIPSRTSYAASKFAVQGYCEGLRAELAGDNVTVHVASPGYIRTGLSLAALTGDGRAHGQMDETTAKGADPIEVAIEILDNVAKGKGDFVVAADLSARAGIWLRLLCPSLLQKMLVKRFQKSNSKEKDE